MSLSRRVDHLEAQLTPPAAVVSWAAVDMAMHRARARAMVTMCRLLEVDPDDPRAAEAAAVLIHDSPSVQAQDDAIMAAWRRQEGMVDTSQGVRVRLKDKLDEVAARLKATTP